MSYQVLARKWRPKNFEELVGQDSARQTLTNALSRERLYPVLIFTGPRGTGKTSTARLVAKSLRCQKKKSSVEPCGTCENCLSISNSSHLDVIEIDGASNNGVEAVRELRDKVSYMPSSGDWKIYIIDEVHMLSNSAFNALLKTLEEPPKHVVFIMATTENHKIPPTVLSRCQKIDFHLLPPLIIKKQLKKICAKESFPISENLLWILARQAEGSLRDAQSLLDQVITFCGATAKEEEVRKLLGLSDPQILEDTLKALILREEKKMVHLIAKLRQKSSSPKIFLQNLLSSVSHLLFLKKNPQNNPPLLPLSQEEIERKKELLSLISYEQLHFLFDMLLKGEREMRLSHDSELILEVLLLRVCSSLQLEQTVPFSPQNQTPSSLQNPSSSDTQKSSSPHNSSSKQNSSKFLSSSPSQANHSPSQSEIKKQPSKNKAPSKSQNLSQSAVSVTKSSPQETASLSTKQSDSIAITKNSPQKTASLSSNNYSHSLTNNNLEKTTNSSKSSAVPPDTDSFKDRFEFLTYIKKKDPLLGSLIDHLFFKRKSEFEFVVCIPKESSYLKQRLGHPDIQKKLEQELSLFLNLNQKASLSYQMEEHLKLSLKQEKDQKEKKELFKQATDTPFIQDVTNIFKVKIQSVKKIDKKEKEL